MSVDLKRISTIDPVANPQLGSVSKNEKLGQGASFQEALAQLDRATDIKLKGDFKQNTPLAQNSAETLKFSNHAVERMRSRGISFSPDQMEKLQMAVKKAAEKGGKDSLVLMNDAAVIVSVKNNTVVTVVDKPSLRENVFTNIDSTIVI